MQLGYIILYVEDVRETVHFYEKAFSLSLRFLHESNQYAEMETGKTALAFVAEKFVADSLQFRKNRPEESAAGAEIAFIAEDVEQAFAKAVAAGAKAEAKPEQKPWGQWVSYVRDNNGFLVEICSAMAD